MKKYTQNTALKSLVTAIAVFGVIAVPVVKAEIDKTASKPETGSSAGKMEKSAVNQTENDRTIINVDRTPLKADVNATFVDGYTVPGEYRTYFTEVPAIQEKNVVVRYHNGRAYYVNSNDWKIVRVVDLDPSVKLAEEDAAMVAGYVIPESRRTRFIDVPNPDGKLSVRYYNNTAYYMDSDFRIVRTVRLSR